MDFKEQLRQHLADPIKFAEVHFQLVLTSAIHLIGHQEVIIILSRALGDTLYKAYKGTPNDNREKVFNAVKLDLYKRLFREGEGSKVVPFPIDIKKPPK